MPIPIFTELGPRPEFKDVVDKVNTLVQELQNLMLSLDTLNIVELNAEVIIAGTITAEKIGAGEITANEIKANTITADRMNVSQLSAIAANLGTINAGTINGILINGSTINGGLINVNTDVNVGNKVILNATTPFVNGGIEFKDNDGDVVSEIDVQSGDLGLKSTGFIFLNAPSGVFVTGGLNANGGITTSVSVMGGDGITPVTLNFTRGMLSSVF